MTPMKARRVVDLVRGRSAADALAILQFAPQAARAGGQGRRQRAANAENNAAWTRHLVSRRPWTRARP